jgi:PAS domain S-box-containing protein
VSTHAIVRATPPSGRGRRASDRALEQVLRDSEEQVRGLLECAPDAMVVSDSDGTIVLVNARVKTLFGYEPEELIGQSVELLVPRRSRSAHRRSRNAFGREPDGRAMRVGRELSACRRDGSEFPVEISLSKMRTPAGATVSASIRDITERKRVEASAAAASRLKSEFVANMSHEIRTPLNGILGMTEMLLETDLEEDQREHVEVIRRSGDVLMGLVEDVLDFSKLEAGKLQLDPFDFDPRAVLEDAVGMVSVEAAHKSLGLTVSVDDSVPAAFCADGRRVRQVLSNLLANAVRFTSAGGVCVSMAASVGDPEELRFEVKDTGIGMDEDVISRVFDSFVQADASTTREYGGCGLGLAICRKLVGLLGGKIHATSIRGAGSTFSFTIPCQSPSAEGSSTSPPALIATSRLSVRHAPTPTLHGAPSARDGAPPGDGESPRILIVEDNEINQIVAVAHLRRLGYSVDVACDGLEAVEQSSREQYSAILMDCQMPRLDGYAATEEIRRGESRTQHVPIIAMTAHALEGDRERCLDSGMDDFLGKPLSRQALAEVVGRNLQSDAGRSPSGALGGVAQATFDRRPLDRIFASEERVGAEIVTLFEDQVHSEMCALAAAIERRDDRAMCGIAHRLKGASLTVGAQGIARVCDMVSEAGGVRDFETLPGAYRELERLARETEAEIHDAFPEGRS